MNTPLKRNNETSREYASRVIQEKIVSLELAPGSKISESELADQLGLSRTPVREAMIELDKIHIINVLPQKGIYVSLIDYELVEEAQFIRYTLECGIMESLCQTGLDPKQEAALVENLRLQEFYVQNPIRNRLFELDDEFHRMLFCYANREMTYELMKSINIHFDRVRSMSTNVEQTRDLSLVHEHWHILEAIIKKDSAQAHSSLVEHLARYKYDAHYIKSHYRDYIKETPDVQHRH